MTPPSGQTTALQAQITALGERMEQGFTELKQIMTGVEGRVRSLETREAGCQPVITAKVDAVAKKVEEHEADLKVLKETVAELKHANRIMTWIGGILGSTLIIWFITQVIRLIQ
jgi:heterodisulfide reductase subunit A-like polyferredoxin